MRNACRIPTKTICQNAGFEGSIVVAIMLFCVTIITVYICLKNRAQLCNNKKKEPPSLPVSGDSRVEDNSAANNQRVPSVAIADDEDDDSAIERA